MIARMISKCWKLSLAIWGGWWLSVIPLFAQEYQIKNDRILAPEVSHFARPNEPGVDAHGDLSLSIPLMTVPGRDGLDFQITAQYRSGIQVTQPASWIGLGWELDVGSVTRHPLGALNSQRQVDFARAIPGDGEIIGSQPDVYAVNMNGNTTLWLSTTKETNAGFPYNPSGGTGGPEGGPCFNLQTPGLYYFVASPWKPWKFCYGTSNPVNVDGQNTTREDFSKFTITTEDGTRYVYGLPTLSETDFPPESGTGYVFTKFASAWRLTAILSPNYPYSGTGETPTDSSPGGWTKISYRTWDEELAPQDESDGNAKQIDTIVYTNPKFFAQLTFPWKIETPTHYAEFKTSKRYDRDLGYFTDPQAAPSSGKYFHRKLDKIILYKKPPLEGGNAEPIWEVSFSYLNNGAPSRIDDFIDVNLKKMLSKLALEKISIKGLQGASSTSLPEHKFSYNLGTLSWYDMTVLRTQPIVRFSQDDFGYFDSDPFATNSPDTEGPMWSLTEIVYPEGGRHAFSYESDSLYSTSLAYAQFDGQGGYNPVVNGAFRRNKEGGPRVKFIKRYAGFSATPDSLRFAYGPGYHSGIPEIWFRKLNSFPTTPFYFSGERGQLNVSYKWVQKTFMDGSRIKTFYKAGNGAEPQTFYAYTALQLALLQSNTRWNWGEVDSVHYVASGGEMVKKDFYHWKFRGDAGDASPIIVGTVAPALGSGNPIYLNFTHKQLDSVITKNYFGTNVVASREAYDYNDGTLLQKKTETSGDGKIRKTENLYVHDLTGLPPTYTIEDTMKYRNMRSQLAQTKVTDNNASNGYVSTATTWKSVNHSGRTKYLLEKEFQWRNKSIPAAIPSFNWTNPDTGIWIRNQTFIEYDANGGQKRILDAYSSETTVYWDGAGTLIDSIKTRPNATATLTTKYGYDPNTFRLTSLTDPNGQKSEYKYDPLQRLIETINPDKRTTANFKYFYSRQGAGSGDNFVTTNPNYVRVLASTHAEHARNHDFETGSTAPDFWTLTTNGSGAIGTWETSGYAGARSVSADVTTAGSNKWVRWKNSTEEKVSPQKRYRMEVWVKTSAGYPNNVAVFKLEFHNAAHASVVQTVTLNLPNSTAWKKCTLDFITAGTADHLYTATLDFTPGSTQAGKIWYDRANFYELNITKTFADGLGRDIEVMPFEGNNRSIQTATYYDFAGRAAKVTKPFASADTNFTLTYNASGTAIAIDSANVYYNMRYPYFPGGASDTYPYAYFETDYHPDPLQRVKNQYFPGTVFSKPGTGQKFVKHQYGANAANEMGFAANKVLEERVTDENGVKTEIFTGTFGNRAGVRIDSSAAGGTENSTKLATAFRYDILNNLTKVAPPRAFDLAANNTPTWTSAFCDSMAYNTFSKLTKRITPDAGAGEYLYDKKGDLRFVKDAKGAAGNYFIYYKYDNLSRKIEEGVMTPATNFTQTNADNQSYPTSGHTWKVKYHYDVAGYAPSVPQRNLKGRMEAVEYVSDRYAVKGYVFYSYDANGNVEWIEQYIPKGNVNDGNGQLATRIEYQYDALGKVTRTYFRRSFPPGASSDAFYTWYDYDALGRLERVFTNTADVKPLTPNAQYAYWPGGQIKRMVLGSAIQGVDYLYNSRDWLTQINHQNLISTQDPGGDGGSGGVPNADRFGQIIGYDMQNHIASGHGDFSPQFNGNISWTIHHTLGITQPVGYGLTGWVFRYDKANRLAKANWGHYTSSWINSKRYDLTGNAAPDSLIKYDRNGNLDYMIRYNENNAATTMDYILLSNTNKLNYIGGSFGQSSGNYAHDANGNMIKDAAKINPTTNTITYDYRNLPQQITKSVAPAGTIYFGYDGKGQRVSKNNLFYIPDLSGRVLAVYDLNGTHLYWNVWGLDLLGQRYWSQLGSPQQCIPE